MSLTVLIPGMTDEQHQKLTDIEASRGVQFRRLLDYETLVLADQVNLDELLESARAEIASFDVKIDAIIPHWDFPTSVLVPILAAENGWRAPSLESVLKCEHKYWSRVVQQESVPDLVPGFALLDPFDDNVADKIELSYPFWVKPVKSHSSQLGFKVNDESELREALAEIREKIGGIGDAFADVLSMVDLPESIQGASGPKCIVEEMLTGEEFAIEGWASNGEVGVHSVFGMSIDEDSHSLDSFFYPAYATPDHIQQKAITAAQNYMKHAGFMDGCFNAEFIWDEEKDTLRIIEFNTRISQSHTEMFLKVHGEPNHLIALDVALGEKPVLPGRDGQFAYAAHCYLTTPEDGIVTKVPSDGEIYAVGQRFPGTVVDLIAHQGDRLSDIPNQDPYRYRLATIEIGADSAEQLKRVYDAVRSQLLFEVKQPDSEEGTGGAPDEVSARDRENGE